MPAIPVPNPFDYVTANVRNTSNPHRDLARAAHVQIDVGIDEAVASAARGGSGQSKPALDTGKVYSVEHDWRNPVT